MRLARRSLALLTLAAIPLTLPACYPTSDKPEDVIMDTLMLVVGAGPAAKPQKLTGQTTIAATVTIGGLTGTYSIDLGGAGSFSGTTKVHGGRSVALRDKGTDGLKTAVASIVGDTFDQTLTVTTAKATFNGRQTTGGVKKLYKGKIVFTGTIGGNKARGTIRTSGDLEDGRSLVSKN